MSKVVIITVSSILIIVLVLIIINQISNRSIRTEVMINDSPSKVWKQLMDHESYAEWNPFIKSISGSQEVNSTLDITIQSNEKSTMNFQPLILVNNPNQEFRWRGKLIVNGIFDGEHYFILEEMGPNKTKLIHGEQFTGLLSGALLGMIKKDTEKGFKAMNSSLKELIEQSK